LSLGVCFGGGKGLGCPPGSEAKEGTFTAFLRGLLEELEGGLWLFRLTPYASRLTVSYRTLCLLDRYARRALSKGVDVESET